MIKNEQLNIDRPKSQTEVDQNVLNFLKNFKISEPKDLVVLRDLMSTLESRPYNNKTKEHADSIQWKRTASEIISDGYVYEGKACSDLAVVYLTLCKALGIDGRLVKLKSIDGKSTHSIVEVNLNGTWYGMDPSSGDSTPFEGELKNESIWNKRYKVWKKGRDVWDLGLDSIEAEDKIRKKS